MNSLKDTEYLLGLAEASKKIVISVVSADS